MAFHYLLRSVISGGFSAFIIYLVRNDSLQYYIAPRMELFVKLVAVGMIMIAVYLAFAAFAQLRGSPIDCDCDHVPSPSAWRNTAAYALLLAPLLFGYFLPDAALGSALAEKKGVVISAGESVAAASSGEGYEAPYMPLAAWLAKQDPIIVREDIYLETSTAIDLFAERFAGKTIQIEGFVYRGDDMAQDRFVVTRMVMDCCTADTTPYGFVVESQAAAAFPDDSWVRVTGAIHRADWNGKEIVLLKPAENGIESIPLPASPYVYPNFDILNGG